MTLPLPPRPSPDKPPTPTRPGNRGQNVITWQTWLNDEFNAGLKVDGDHGPKTEKATTNYFYTLPHGIDVSSHQLPVRFDWAAIAETQSFTIARVAYGTRPDSRYDQFHTMARDFVVFGAYTFFRQTQDPKAQAETFIALANLEKGDIVPVVDLEPNERWDGPLDPDAHNGAGRALTEALATHYGAAMLYISPGHWLTLGRPDWVLEHHIWTAHWGASRPAWPDDWAVWQHRVGPIAGYPARLPIDQNFARYLPRVC